MCNVPVCAIGSGNTVSLPPVWFSATLVERIWLARYAVGSVTADSFPVVWHSVLLMSYLLAAFLSGRAFGCGN